MTKHLILAWVLLVAAGCAFTPHEADLVIDQPQIPVEATVNGARIQLTVIDERDKPDLGRRGAGFAAAKISADDLMPKFTKAVEDGFRAKGYELIGDQSLAAARLVVALRTLKFEESAGIFTVGAEVDATILATATRNSNEFRNQYRSSDEERQLAVSFGSGIDEQLNVVLNPPYSPPFRREGPSGPVAVAFCDRAHRKRTCLSGEDARPSETPQTRA